MGCFEWKKKILNKKRKLSASKLAKGTMNKDEITKTKTVMAILNFEDPLEDLNDHMLKEDECKGLPLFEGCEIYDGCSHCRTQYFKRKECAGAEECYGCGTWCRWCLESTEGGEAWPEKTRGLEVVYCKQCSDPVEASTEAAIIDAVVPGGVEIPGIVGTILGYLGLVEQVTVEVRIPPRIHVPVECQDCGVKKSRTAVWVEEFGSIITCRECVEVTSKAKDLLTMQLDFYAMKANQMTRRAYNGVGKSKSPKLPKLPKLPKSPKSPRRSSAASWRAIGRG